MRRILLKVIRSKMLQPFWVKVNHISLVGMNYFGGASFTNSGEIPAMLYMKGKLKQKQNIVIFDVGANSGDYSLLANSLFERKAIIHAFEPSTFTFGLLTEKTNSFTQIKPHKVGIGSENSTMNLYTAGKGRTTASVYNLKSRESDFSEDFTERIEVTTIDTFCSIEKIRFIDILKLDIEGHELAALRGAKSFLDSLSVNFIQFEFGKCDLDAKVYFRNFFEILSPRFKIYRIVSDGLFEIEKYDASLEVFHTANFLAERRGLTN